MYSSGQISTAPHGVAGIYFRFLKITALEILENWVPKGPIGPDVGNPVKKSHFPGTCAQNEISLGETIWIWMETVVEMDLRNLILRALARKMRFRLEKKRSEMGTKSVRMRKKTVRMLKRSARMPKKPSAWLKNP